MGIKQSYENWHKNPIHGHIHWTAFTATSLFLSLFLISQINLTYDTVQAAVTKSVITQNDITFVSNVHNDIAVSSNGMY